MMTVTFGALWPLLHGKGHPMFEFPAAEALKDDILAVISQ